MGTVVKDKDGSKTDIGGEMITFTCSADTKDTVFLVLYDGEKGPVAEEREMAPDPLRGSIRTLSVGGLVKKNVYYNFRINGRIVNDPAAKVVTGRGEFGNREERTEHQIRCAFADDSFDWGDDAPLHLPEKDLIAYGLHVRGFTASQTSRVRHKGTFRGISEKTPYLQKLGITQVILMPAYEFDEIMQPSVAHDQGPAPEDARPAGGSAAGKGLPPKKLNYWGYGPGFYYAPKESYASGRPDTEARQMVKTLHAAGIEVIMEFAFPDDTDAQFAIDVLSWWVTFYHVDGFRLLCSDSIVYAAARSPLLRSARLMAGYFDTDQAGMRDSSLPRALADFNDSFRNDLRCLLRGDENRLQALSSHLSFWDDNKSKVVYMTCHDGFTLADLVSYDQKHNEENGEQNRDGAECEFSWNCGEEGPTRKKNIKDLRLKQMKNALCMEFLSRSIPMIMAGDECCNSQEGNSNPYCIDSETTYVTWKRDAQAKELTAFVTELIRFRQEHHFVEPAPVKPGQDPIPSGYPAFSCHGSRAWYGGYEYQNRHMGVMYCTPTDKGVEYLYFAFNFHWESRELALPYLPGKTGWKQILSTAKTGNDEEGFITRQITLPPRTVCILKGVPEE